MAEWGKIFSRGNVEDRRGRAPLVAGGIGVTGLALYLLLNFLTDGQVTVPVDQLQNILGDQQLNQNTQEFEGLDTYEQFASTVLGSNNELWQKKFQELNQTYTPPKLVLFRVSTESACGGASSQVGPHYCPLDQTIYLDETFFDELTGILGAQGGDVAEAYVVSHEVGHHVQNLLGTIDDVNDNASSIKLELQSDCYAGVWANSLKDLGVLSPGEISEAMDAAAAVGDDRIQSQITGRVTPENWTHGSSADRVSWFTRGYDSGNISSCDTFK